MQKLLLAVALLGVTACAPGPAAAGFSLSIAQPGFGLFISDAPPAYYGPPAYYAPPVAFVPPPPVHVIHHPPVYYAPRSIQRHHGHGRSHGRGYGWDRVHRGRWDR